MRYMSNLIFILVIISSNAFAFDVSIYSANHLKSECTSQYYADESACLDYLRGYLDAAYMFGQNDAGKISPKTFANIFSKHMQDRPQDGDMMGMELLKVILLSKEIK